MYQQTQGHPVFPENITVNAQSPMDPKEVLARWAELNAGKRVVSYRSAVEKILTEAGYNVKAVDKGALQKMRQKFGWSDRNIWPTTAWNSFCRFGATISPELFAESSAVLNARRTLADAPAQMTGEIEDILAAHIVRTTGEKMPAASQRQILRSFAAFLDFAGQSVPGREINSLSDFTPEDARGFRDRLIKSCVSPFTSAKVSLNAVSMILINLRRVFKIGLKQGKLKMDIFAGISIEKHKSPKREFCLTKEHIEKLRTVGVDKDPDASLKKRFEHIRDNAMVSAQYEPALRSEDVVSLCWEDLSINERAKSNVGPVVIRGGKSRPRQHEDRVYLLLNRLDADLYRWKQISQEYCEAKGIVPPSLTVKGRVYHPVFFSANGRPLTPSSYGFIFARQLKKAGLSLPMGYKTHIVRHSRITHWVDEGMPFEKVHENARHANLDDTWGYFHSNASRRIEAVEKLYGLDKDSRALKTAALPKSAVLRAIIEITLEAAQSAHLPQDAPAGVKTTEIEKIIRAKCMDRIQSGERLTYREIMDMWGLGRSQTWERLIKLQKMGLIHPVKLSNKKIVYLKEEIRRISSLVDSRKAAIAFGYKEKVPTTIPGLAQRGLVKSTKIGKLHFFEPGELLEHFYEKNRK